MSNISDLWDAIPDFLLTKKTELGIVDAKRGEAGKASELMPPGCLVTMEFKKATLAGNGTVIHIDATVRIFCISSQKMSSADALEESLAIGAKLLKLIPNTIISNTSFNVAKDEEPLQIVQEAADCSVVAVPFSCQIKL